MTHRIEHPERIGPYHILQVIGEGGMGVVYEAEQREPVRRRVAIKMMKIGMDTREIVGRFEAERQALAVMDHPGIAKVLDAGASDEGRPYFVMELVRGLRIDRFCDQERLSVGARLQLFIQVCEAVQHAHQKGVIHRDLKPTNVLVAEVDGRPRPKIIDFGVAKALGQQLSEQTYVTTLGQPIGTLAYMSPEQASMSGLDIDTRADIYSLSVLLYQLLTGTLPLDPDEVGGPVFLHHLVQRDESFPTLVQRLAHLSGEDVVQRAVDRSTDPGGLKKGLSGDLQWIILKGMEKDRARRYETANGLAMDLRRLLADEPVVARPPTAGYRLAKFVRRNRVASAAGALVVSTLALGATLATLGMLEARRAERVAREEAEVAARVTSFLEGIFEVNSPGEARGNSVTAREILDAGAARIEDDLAGQPEIRARLTRTMGTVYRNLGLLPEAEALLRRSLETQESDPDPPPALRGRTLLVLAGVVADRGERDEAEELFEESVRSLDGLEDQRLLYARALRAWGFHRVVSFGDWTAADTLVRGALAVAEEVLAPDDPELAGFLSSLALLYDDDTAFSEPLQRRAFELRAAAYGWDDPRTISSGHNLYMTLSQRIETAREADTLMRRVVAATEAVYGPDHLATARARSDYTLLLYDLGRHQEAIELLRPALATLEAGLGPHSAELALTRYRLGQALLATDQLGAGDRETSMAVADLETAVGRGHHYTALAVSALGDVRLVQRRFAEAEALYREALETLEATFGEAHASHIDPLTGLGVILAETGRSDEAATLLDRALTLCLDERGPGHPCEARIGTAQLAARGR